MPQWARVRLRQVARGRGLARRTRVKSRGVGTATRPHSHLTFFGAFFWGHLSNKVVFIPLVVCLSAGIPPYLRAFAATGGYYMHTEVLRPYVSLPESVPELTNEQ